MPCPQPRAKDPPAYDKEELQTLLTAIASSSWDSVYAEARQPLRGGQGFELDEDVRERRRVRPSSPTDLSLQASPVAVSPPPVATVSRRRWSNSGFQPSLHAAVAGVWVCLLILLNMSHKPVAVGSTARPANPYRVDSPDSNAIVDGQPVSAADQEPSDTTQAPDPAPRPIPFNAQAAKNAAASAALYWPLLW